MALEAFARVLPVLLLVGVGVLMRRIGFLSPETVAGLRRLVLDVTLPAALLLAFLGTDLEARYAVIVVGVFGACLVVLVAAPSLLRLARVESQASPLLMAGFEAGMLGYALYAALFGIDELYRFAIVDLGQVLFVFFVLVPVVVRRATGVSPSWVGLVAAFSRTPVILAIAAGLAGSALGVEEALRAQPVGEALLETLALLAALTTPLIAIVIGYSTTLRASSLRDPMRTVAMRLPLWIGLGLAFDVLVIDALLGLDRLFGAAVLTMAILPPPFVVPLYMARARAAGQGRHDEEVVVNTLSVATVATLAAITFVAAAYAG